MEVKITGVIHRLIFKKKKDLNFFFIFFFLGGGGIFVQIIGGGGHAPPVPPPIPTALRRQSMKRGMSKVIFMTYFGHFLFFYKKLFSC